MPSYDRAHCSCLLSRDYVTDASSLYRRYYVLQQTALLAEQTGLKEHPASCPKHEKQKTQVSRKEFMPLIDAKKKLFNRAFANLQERKNQLDGSC